MSVKIQKPNLETPIFNAFIWPHDQIAPKSLHIVTNG